MAIRLDDQGYFVRDQQVLYPMGANYWPGSCGVAMWSDWPADEIQQDLDLLPALGLNTVRFFLRWDQFEPTAGQYDAAMFQRLGQFMGWCAQRSLLAHPSLLTVFMSGGDFRPDWARGRNLFSDGELVQRAVLFATRASQTISPFADHVLAVDQGNELCCLADCQAAMAADVQRFCWRLSDAIHNAMPGALVISGNEQNQVINDTGWHLGRHDGYDLYSMHGYPVPAWHALGFDGMTDPLCQSLLPFYTQMARAFGPVLVQEFGTILTAGAAQQDAYLRAVLPACRDAGANGFLWWCLRDISAMVHPYLKANFEAGLGLVDATGKVKPGLEYFIDFARQMSARPAASANSSVGLYLPRHYYHRDEPVNPGNIPAQLSQWLGVANYLLRRLNHKPRIVRGDLPLPDGPGTLVLAGAIPDAQEIIALETWVRQGGRLIWHGPDPIGWGPLLDRLLGAQAVDFRSLKTGTVRFAGQSWPLRHYPRNMRLQVSPQTAQVLATDTQGLPVVLRHRLGQGSVIVALPLIEQSIAAVSADRQQRDRWTAWYEAMLNTQA
jgi:hypothetical protein